MKAAIIGASEEALHTIEKAHEYGLTVVALDGNGKAPGLSAADKALVVDISDEEETIRAVREEKAAFVLTVPIGRYLTTIGAVNDALTLPGISKEMAVLCTDKYSFHKTLFEQGLRSCHCYGVGNHLGDETPNDVLAEKLVNGELSLAFPAILKPRFGSGSRGIHMLNRREELERALQEAEGESYVLEECIEGEEYGVDGAMVGSDFQMVLLRYKRNTPPPARQAVAYFSVQPADPFYEQVKVYMQRVTACLGLRECLLHADLIRGENGPFVIELSARPSGHNLHNLFTPLCTGVDVAEEYIKYRMGKPFCFVPKQTKSMMIHYFDMQGEVKQVPDQVQVEQTLKELHQISENGLPEVSLIKWECHIIAGEALQPVSDGHSLMGRGYFILEGDDQKELALCAEKIKRMFF